MEEVSLKHSRITRSKEIFVECVQIRAEAWVFLPELLVFVPLLKRLVDFVLTNLKHGFGICSACLLQAPSRRVIKAETAGAGARILLLEVIAHLETREGLSLAPERITAIVVAANTLSF